MEKNSKTIDIFSIKFNDYGKGKHLNEISERLRNGQRTVIFTPNTQMLLKAEKSERLRKLLNKADIRLPDGIGVLIAAQILGTPLNERISGIDMGEALLALATKEGYSVFLLGGKKGRARKTARHFQKKYPALNICGCHNGYFSKTGIENTTVIKKIVAAKPDIIFVCLGFPAQEEWIINNISELPSVKLAIGLGGSFDVWSGNIRRSPLLMRKYGLEWLWRAILEPKRLKILLDIPCFFCKIEKQKRTRCKLQRAR